MDVNAVHPGVVDTELPRNLPVNLWAPLKALGAIISVEEVLPDSRSLIRTTCTEGGVRVIARSVSHCRS